MQRLNIKAVIRNLGGARALAGELGVSVPAVYDWIRDNSLPLQRAIDMAGRLGVDRDLLHDPWRGHGQDIMSEEETELFLKALDKR